ncbi:hypothetical protein [Nocardioides sp. CFH 31398]|uniref:hypothetical protein n=1 Tax=Nocardioides sp. CFH 31398 TaxID=2919579 RepID=UPI001F059EA1|nr:hypothetical protein [Nocardioides sp. CFH 31398]MCH1867100.1 hypothetical protein [Nocardioides sp. CFH 31398]
MNVVRRLRRRLATRRLDEGGTAMIELVWLGLLLLVPVVYIVLTAFEVQRGAFATAAAARAAGRAYSLSESDAEGRAQAEAVARRAFLDQGLERTPDLRVSCAPADVCLSGGSVITVVVDTRIDLPLLPDVLGGNRPSIAVDATHSVPYGQYQEVR